VPDSCTQSNQEEFMHSLRNYLLGILLLALSSFAVGQTCAPPTYGCARSDLIKTNNLNPPPVVSQKNAVVTPSDFRLPIVRATDGAMWSKKTLTVTNSGSNGDNIFNVDDTYVLVVDGGGWTYPLAFSPSTLHTLNTSAWKIGTNQVRWAGTSSFSRVNRSVLYTIPSGTTPIKGVNPNGSTLYKITLAGTSSITASGVPVFDFAKCPGMRNPYGIGNGIWHSVLTVSKGDTRFAVALSNQGGQNSGTDIVVYDAPSGHCYRYDTAHARLCISTGCMPMSLSDEYKIHEVYMSLDGKYLRITIGSCITSGCLNTSGTVPYIWQIGTTEVTRCTDSAGNTACTGHMVEGYSHLYNSLYWPIVGRRLMSDPLSYGMLNTAPVLSPRSDQHYSNNAADNNDTNPIWVTNVQNIRTKFGGAGCNKTGNLYFGCTFPAPLYGEVFGITSHGGYIRAAHTYNSGSSAYFNCSNTIGSVSQSGRFFAWSSDWLNTLGIDNFGRHRCDVFIVDLAAAQGATH
jgi:hypothetical protein